MNQYMTWGEYIDEEVEEACKTARKEARAEGLAEGRAEGLAEGLTEGRKKGREEEKYRLLIKLVKDGTISVEIAAKESDMSVRDFEKKFL